MRAFEGMTGIEGTDSGLAWRMTLCIGVSGWHLSDREGLPFATPKGQKDSARGFNPGLDVLKRRALKMAPDWVRSSPSGTCRKSRGSNTILCPFRARAVRTSNPGLKPRAEFWRPFGASTS
jgi:hypothetical protein